MSFFGWLLRLFGLGDAANRAAVSAPNRRWKWRSPPVCSLVELHRAVERLRTRRQRLVAPAAVKQKPYDYAYPALSGEFFDLSRDGDDAKLARFGLPQFHTPQELADWLGIPLGKLAWLAHRFDEGHRPKNEHAAHYHYCWIRKRSGGERLIESPKPLLKAVQNKILREILDRVPSHSSAHGFVIERSVRTNAAPHVRQRVVVKLDLEKFYPSVSFNRVIAVFRGLGYSRETAIWLARITTSDLPSKMRAQSEKKGDLAAYMARHLPQGAPTSPALANFSAFSLDLRLAGLSRTFGVNYTRYADDLTFSGDEKFLRSLAVFLPLAEKIIRSCRFRVNKKKRRVIRNSQRQQVTGVVVNEKPNISRKDYDRLKATLVNCIRRGPSTQNHDRHADFAAHLRGRIAHVTHLNPARGEKLLGLFRRINWKT